MESTKSDSTIDEAVDEELETLYAAVLDHLLFPAAVKAELIRTQTKEKKKQMVEMHKSAIEKDVIASWGERETNYLTILMKSKVPDIKMISHIKLVLTTANRAVLSSFIDNYGINILIKCINDRVSRMNITELDAAILFEIVSCLKVTMNNETGMEAVLGTDDAITSLARCLLFEWKVLSTLVLEILSCCCYYSEIAAKCVIDALRSWSITRGEKSFAGLVSVFSTEDIRTRYDVLSLINQMIMAVDDVTRRSILRDEFIRLLLPDKVKVSIKVAEMEIGKLEQNGGEGKDLITITGSKFFDLKVKSTTSPTAASTGISSRMSYREVKKMTVASSNNIQQGIMVGYCIMSKGQDAKSMVADLLGFGGKKTKRRWCILDGDTFLWSTEKEKDTTAGNLSMTVVNDIRNFTSDQGLSKLSMHCFEIETSDKVLSFACESATERDNWIVALRAARDKCVISSSEFKLKSAILSVPEAKDYLEQLKKNMSLFESIWLEDRKYTTTSEGLDTGNFNDMLRFIQLQTLAGDTEMKLHELLYQLVVLPPGMEGMWDTVISSAKKYRVALAGNSDGLDPPVRASANSAYQQISKLALLVITAENEVKALRQRSSVVPRRGSGMRSSFVETERPSLVSLKEVPSENDLKEVAIQKIPDLDIPDQSDVPLSNKSNQSNQSNNEDIVPMVFHPTGSDHWNKRYSKYVEMRKILPEMAVRQKMDMDGLNEHEISKFFDTDISVFTTEESETPSPTPVVVVAAASDTNNTTSTSTPSLPSPPLDPKFEKYIKMKKMLPEGAVRQKMSRDGVSEEDIDTFMSGDYSTVTIPATTIATSSNTTEESSSTLHTTVLGSDPRYDKYIKMKKMLPEGAVRQKMSVDGFTQEEIDTFMSGDYSNTTTSSSTPPPPTTLSLQTPTSPGNSDPRYIKYEKMKRMLPESAVRQKMSVEGFSQTEIDLFFGCDNPLAALKLTSSPNRQSKRLSSSSTPKTVSSFANDPKFEKYVKMQKMLPEGAVRQKMATDGISSTDIDQFFGIEPAITTSSLANDPKFEKYVKMQKMLPEGAVRQKMATDGISSTDIDQFFGSGSSTITPSLSSSGTKPALGLKPAAIKAPPPNLPPPGFKEKPLVQPSKKMKALFWTKISNESIEKTIWTKIDDFQFTSTEEKELEEWFAAAAAANKKATEENNDSNKTGAEVKAASLLDGKKTQNVLIALGKLRRTPAQITECIIKLTVDVLTQEMTETLIDVAPSPEELTQVKAYTGKEENLDRASAFYYHICQIPRLQLRLECHALAFKWFPDADELQDRYDAILVACKEVQSSEPQLLKMLSLILAIGNYMNGGTNRGQAYGIKLEIIKKLSTIKAESADRGSILHFIANLAFNRSPDLLTFSDNWTALWATNEITLRELDKDVKRLAGLVDKAKSELSIGVPIVLKEKGEDMSKPLSNRLEWFLSNANPKLTAIMDTKLKATNFICQLAESFGESSDLNGETDPTVLVFDPITSFAKAFKAAVDELAQAKKKQEKALAAAAMQNARKASIDPANAATTGNNSLTSNNKKKVSDNIFASFNTAKTASTESVVNEFKERLKKRAGNQANSVSLANLP